MRMNWLTSADPLFMVFGTPGSSVAALDLAAVPWVEQHLSVPGDYNGDGTVEAADYVLWRNGGPLHNDLTPDSVSGDDYVEWRARYGDTAIAAGSRLAINQVVPEPIIWQTLFVLALSKVLSRFSRKQRQ
jgi:hypothetical protein